MAASVRWIWELSVVAQIVVCAVLFLKGNFRRVPGFAAYVVSNICQAGLLFAIYSHFGFRSRMALVLAWLSQLVTLLLRVLAISELLRLILKPYRGIWGLGWRLLGLVFGGGFCVALIDSGRNLSSAIVLADRGFHFAFGVALVACFLLVRYYSLPVHPVYKALLGGFCCYSCAVSLTDTLGRTLFLRGNTNFEIVWQLSTLIAFVAASSVWAVALFTPLPEPGQGVEFEQAKRLYLETSTQVNERLHSLNVQLNRLWNRKSTTIESDATFSRNRKSAR